MLYIAVDTSEKIKIGIDQILENKGSSAHCNEKPFKWKLIRAKKCRQKYCIYGSNKF